MAEFEFASYEWRVACFGVREGMGKGGTRRGKKPYIGGMSCCFVIFFSYCLTIWCYSDKYGARKSTLRVTFFQFAQRGFHEKQYHKICKKSDKKVRKIRNDMPDMLKKS